MLVVHVITYLQYLHTIFLDTDIISLHILSLREKT